MGPADVTNWSRWQMKNFYQHYPVCATTRQKIYLQVLLRSKQTCCQNFQLGEWYNESQSEKQSKSEKKQWVSSIQRQPSNCFILKKCKIMKHSVDQIQCIDTKGWRYFREEGRYLLRWTRRNYVQSLPRSRLEGPLAQDMMRLSMRISGWPTQRVTC